MSKIAIGSKDGININEHFGMVQEFLIYEVSQEGNYHLLEKRKNEFSHNGNQDPGKHGSRLHVVAELLADVEVVLVSQLGPDAKTILEEKGIRGVAVSTTIDKALSGFSRRGKLFESPFKF